MGAGPGIPETTGTHPDPKNKQTPDGGKPPAGKGGSMTPEELLAKDPACYKAVMALGEKAAVEKERERVNAHLKLGESVGSLDTAAKYIRDGASVMSEEVQSEYLSLSMKKNAVNNRDADNPGAIHTGGGESEDDAKALAAFEAAYSGKDYRGGR